MSDIFHKSCYTSRSTGYKYRTLSTNTGERRRRSSQENNTFERKFRELQREITSRINREVDKAQDARESINEKFNKINARIDSMIELQNTVVDLRKQLQDAEYVVVDMMNRINKISSVSSEFSQKSMFRVPTPIFEETELFSSTVTHV